ncbi:MAG TPA: cytochrome d ubiquinol oxidase subunit II [Acetobacteraceae bacterium]|jgi:cytochrome d ubiquinol oxidase subunit II
MNPAFDFVPVWTLILGAAVFFYVLLDGFDLGIGILHRFAADERSRAVMVASVAPVWDGNETWLVFGALALLGAFPLAYAIIIPAVYFPVAIMLLSLIFRGVAFEFRYHDTPYRRFWDRAFEAGSLIATFAQGIVLGAFIQGFQTDGHTFTGSSLDCFTPFSIVTGAFLVFGYALLGAGWLVLKTEGALHAWARECGRFALVGVCVGLLVVSIWTPLTQADVAQRWFTWPNFGELLPVPLVSAAIAGATWRALGRPGASFGPYAGAVGLFAMSYLGLAISLWPMIVPHHITLWQAAANPSTQAFLLVGTLFLLPIILMYSGWSYWVFRGKARPE